jgi:hypothetical protein
VDCIIPLNKALGGLTEVIVDHAVAQKIVHGVPMLGRDIDGTEIPAITAGQIVKIVSGAAQLIAVVAFLVDSIDISPQVRVWKSLRTFFN